ncbi:MAG: hypothetical protein AAGE99_01200 [Chlamydiota bacterium]
MRGCYFHTYMEFSTDRSPLTEFFSLKKIRGKIDASFSCNGDDENRDGARSKPFSEGFFVTTYLI